VVDKIKNYGITGVAANVELGKGGVVISGTSADGVNLVDREGLLIVANVAPGTEPEHIVNKSQLDVITNPKLKYSTFLVNYNDDVVALANVSANTHIQRTVIQTVDPWTEADGNTNITVGDELNNSRLFSTFDPSVQTDDETTFQYTENSTINAYVTAGGARAGSAQITVWYRGTLN
jgi:hypothetical protein